MPWLWDRGVPANIYAAPAQAVRLMVEAAIQQGQPVLARTWEGTYYHWTPLIAFDQNGVTRHQVLGGGVETLTWDDWLDRYAGWLVVVPATRGSL